MSKRSLIILLVALFLVIVGIAYLFYVQSFRTVHFNFKNSGSDLKITVYKKEGENRASIDTLTGNKDLRLQAGQYVYIPSGQIYSPAPIDFTVGATEKTVDVNPDYSSTYRKSLLASELPVIKAALQAKYPSIISDFIIDDGEILKQGQWYATILTQRTPSPDEEGDIYRVVLEKESGKWTIKNQPALVLSAKDHTDIPHDILSSINAR